MVYIFMGKNRKNRLTKFREPNNIIPVAFTAIEQDIYALILCELSKESWASKHKDTTINFVDNLIEFSITELKDYFDCSLSNLSKNVRSASNSLCVKEINITLDDGNNKNIKLLDSCEFHINSGLHIEVNKEAKELIFKFISNNYSEIDLNLYLNLKSKHSKRLLKFISQWKMTKFKTNEIKMSKYRKSFSIDENKYLRTEAFIRKCIDEPIKEILNKSDNQWILKDEKGYLLKKEGRKIGSIVFTVFFNKKDEDADNNDND